VVAAISNGQLQRLTRAHQDAEKMGLARDFRGLPEPWIGFREQTEAALRDIFVSRAEARRARGEAHAATIKQVRKVDGADVVFERKAIEKLTLKDLALIPVPEPYGKVADPIKLHTETVASLQSWIEAGKPKAADKLPRSPKGDVVRKVRVATSDKVAVDVRGGTADRGEMARVDVFTKSSPTGTRQYFLVPIYPHEIAESEQPPNRAVQGGGGVWPIVDRRYAFLWSVYPMSLIELTKPDGEVILGYFRGLDRSTGAINLSAVSDSTQIRRSIGARTLLEFKKFAVDRLGCKSEVGRGVERRASDEAIAAVVERRPAGG
jgi:CRISPR-associated endonuclease Csn1